MLTVHHLNQSRSHRDLGLEELSCPMRLFTTSAKTMLAPSPLNACIRWASHRSLKTTG